MFKVNSLTDPNEPSDICRDNSHRTQRREAELGGIGGDGVITPLRCNHDDGIHNLKYTAKTSVETESRESQSESVDSSREERERSLREERGAGARVIESYSVMLTCPGHMRQ